ncbi:MAG: F0F1 ATP synthase subunit A [Desulfovibrionaceae bacterium]|nr:F0F1 ATP synthase subunit A [Desulfovibrionaceae bacterium]
MDISPDWTVYAQWGAFRLNATIVNTWLVMALLVFLSWLATRRLSSEVPASGWQNALEAVVSLVSGEIRQVTGREPWPFVPFLCTIFLFVAASNLLSVVPWFRPPTGSLSTTAALALCVFGAVPVWGVSRIGFRPYVMNYFRPSPLMLPFNVMGEFSRTLALAVRLFGNVMSGNMIAAILLLIAPLVFPVLLQLLGLLTGLVQAYIFFILAAVYAASGMEVQENSLNR